MAKKAWRNHAVSENTAFVIQNSTSLLDACSHSMFGVKLYTIPYFQSLQRLKWRKSCIVC